jgi:hypothetical protein
MMPRPFVVTFRPVASQDVLDVRLSFAAPGSAEQLSTMSLFLKEVFDFLRCGAAGGDGVDPAAVSLTPAPPVMDPGGVHFALSQVRLASASMSCLLNMLEWGHHHIAPLLGVSVSWAPANLLPDPLALLFPSAWPASYPLEIEDLERRFTIAVELDRPHTEEEIERIEVASIAAWATGLNRGAYGNEHLRPAECALLLTEDAVEILPNGFVWFVDALRCDDAALDGLTNALERMHRTIAVIRRVTIE